MKKYVLEKFKSENKSVLKDIIEELKKKDFIEVEYPFMGFGFVNILTGETSFPHANPNDFRKCKIKTAGIEYVKQNLFKKNDSLDRWSKIIGIGGIIFGSVIGAVTLVRENKYREANQLNKELQSGIDSINAVLRANEIDHESLLRTRDKEIYELTSKIDSLSLKFKK